MSDTEVSRNFILLSKLINRLSEIEYYQTFAKTLLVTTNNKPKDSNKAKNVEYMFHYFIDNELLNIYHENKIIDTNSFNTFEDLISTDANKEILNWKEQIYINLNDLKILYANKCIVFPVSLIKEIQKT